MLILLRDALNVLRFAVSGFGTKSIKYFAILLFFFIFIYNYLLFCLLLVQVKNLLVNIGLPSGLEFSAF